MKKTLVITLVLALFLVIAVSCSSSKDMGKVQIDTRNVKTSQVRKSV